MAGRPKSFWDDSAPIDTEQQWITHYDDWPLMRLEAELIFGATSRGIAWEQAQEMELWQLASAFGLHRVETRKVHDEREIVQAKQAYWEETAQQRAEHLSGYSERRKARELERRQQRRGQREPGS